MELDFIIFQGCKTDIFQYQKMILMNIFYKPIKTNQMKDFIKTLDFLEKQQEENSLNTYQLHLIIQTMATFVNDENLNEIETAFNIFKN